MAVDVSGIVTYVPAAYPKLDGALELYFTKEHRHIADSLKSTKRYLEVLGSSITTGGWLVAANNLSDLTNVATARTNLGLGSVATLSDTLFARVANNLSDLANVTTARTNLGLGTAAVQNVAAFLQPSNNLSDVALASTARTNLGLGTAATQNVGVAANNVVQLNGTSQLPAVDGSLLTGIAQAGRLIAGTPLVLNPVAMNGTTTQAHGLGVAPAVLTYVFECLTADLGYSVGDKLNIPLRHDLMSTVVDATNVVLLRANTSLVLIHKSTFASSVVTLANWKLTVTPYKLT